MPRLHQIKSNLKNFYSAPYNNGRERLTKYIGLIIKCEVKWLTHCRLSSRWSRKHRSRSRFDGTPPLLDKLQLSSPLGQLRTIESYGLQRRRTHRVAAPAISPWIHWQSLRSRNKERHTDGRRQLQLLPVQTVTWTDHRRSARRLKQ